MTAPTMVRNWLIPGSPELLGSISICIGSRAERTGAASVRKVRVFTMEAPSIRGSTVLLLEQVRTRGLATRPPMSEVRVSVKHERQPEILEPMMI